MKYTGCELDKTFEITSMVTAFRKGYGCGYYYKGESHDFWEFICVLKGCIQVAVDCNVYELHENQVIFLKPLQFHNMCSIHQENAEILIMSFRVSPVLEMEQQVVTIHDDICRQLLNLFDMAKEIFVFEEIHVKSIRDGYRRKAQIFSKSLESWILSRMEESDIEEKPVLTVCAVNYSKIVEVLKNNIDRNLRIKDIAKLTGMSESNVKKTFSMYANQGIMNYFQQLKIIEAKRLLAEGNTVGEVSQKLGYSEQNYFSIVFKKATGYAPKYWLKEMEKKNVSKNKKLFLVQQNSR